MASVLNGLQRRRYDIKLELLEDATRSTTAQISTGRSDEDDRNKQSAHIYETCRFLGLTLRSDRMSLFKWKLQLQ